MRIALLVRARLFVFFSFCSFWGFGGLEVGEGGSGRNMGVGFWWFGVWGVGCEG